MASALAEILGYLGGSHVPAVLECLPGAVAPLLRQTLLKFIERVGRGHEAAMAALFPSADVDLSLGLVRILAALGTPAARDAIAQAARSPHPIVRIEALGHVEGVSSERLRLELRTLIEDPDPSVRLAVLRTMTRYGIRVAGPFLVLRIRSPIFDTLPVDERREALDTVCALAPNRFEAVATELLRDTRLLSSDAHEETRALAAEALGRSARGTEAVQALSEAEKRRLRGSARVREAAARALQQIAQRERAQEKGKS
jgi:HEAT repeat protein